MAFKLVTVLCATLAFAHAGLLAPAYSPANEVSTVYSSIGSIGHQQVLAHGGPVLTAHSAPIISAHSAPVVTAHSAPLIAAHSAPLIAAHSAPLISAHTAPVLATRTYAAAAPVISAPIARVAYSPANEVSQVYSSIAAPQLAYGSHDQLAYAHASPAIGTSQQSTIRSLGGTISSYSKAVDTPFSSVRKSDTRISNNYYTPALATKTIAYQQPAIIEQKSIPATVVSHVTFDGLGTHYAW